MPFAKGVSGNPDGRPRALREFREMAQAKSDIAFGVLLDALESDDERTRLTAAKEILDRAWGKAPQSVTGDDGAPLIPGGEALLEALRAMAGRP